MKDFAIRAGKRALPYYGKVASQIKSVRVHDRVSESPVTVLDHAIQELFLAELIQHDLTNIGFNGEEDTHLKFFFSNTLNDGMVVHCDPIDGTEGFASGKGRFAVGMGISHAQNGVHRFSTTVIYAPLEDTLYWSHHDSFSSHSKVKNPDRTISFRRTLNPAGAAKVKKMGYRVVFPSSLHLSLIDVALGRIGAVIPGHTNVHDVLVPYSFAHNYGVTPTDYEGNSRTSYSLKPHASGFDRIHDIAYFANKEMRDELVPILSNPKYMK